MLGHPNCGCDDHLSSSEFEFLVVFKGPVLWNANNRNQTGLGLEKTATAVPVSQFLRTKDRGPRPVRTANL